MRPSVPPRLPSPAEPSPPLAAQIGRDFGSAEDFRRTLERMCAERRGDVWLILTPQGRLRLVCVPPYVRPQGLPLFRFPAAPPPPPHGAPPPPPPPPRPDWREINGRFSGHMARRPPYPAP